jgi:hypothetical protein
MATFTSSELYGGMKMNHTGINVAQNHILRALSVSEVAYLARIPNQATILRAYLSGGTTGITTGTWSLGFAEPVVNALNGASLTVDSLAAAISLTSSAQFIMPVVGGTLFPIKVSLSDDQAHVWIRASCLGSFTATTTSSLRLVVEYVVPGG